MDKKGRLIVVGTGLQVGHLTPAARTSIESAEEVLYLVASSPMEALISTLNPAAQSLAGHYSEGKHRARTYTEIVARILTSVRAGKTVCAVFYGHAGIFVHSSHASVRQARREGFEATMLPGISALDCLIADLGIDPARGIQQFDATNLLVFRRPLDPSLRLVVWQAGTIGNFSTRLEGEPRNQGVLADYLAKFYGADHPVFLYEAPVDPGMRPRIEKVLVGALASARLTPNTTLYIPPKERPTLDPKMVAQLGITEADLDEVRKLKW